MARPGAASARPRTAAPASGRPAAAPTTSARRSTPTAPSPAGDGGGRRPGRRRGRRPRAARPRGRRPSTAGQRGWKRQPFGGSRRSGGEPGIVSRRPPVGVDVRERAEQLLRVRVARRGEDPRDGALLGDLAGVHDQRPVARLGDHRQVVGDEDQPQAELAAEALEELEDLGLDHDVEGGRRLVADDDRRIAGERHRDHRPLAHPARQLVRIGRRPLPRGMPTSSSSSAARLRATGRATARAGPRSARRSGRRSAGPG